MPPGAFDRRSDHSKSVGGRPVARAASRTDIIDRTHNIDADGFQSSEILNLGVRAGFRQQS